MNLRAAKDRIKRSPFFIKLGSWEYWPMNLIYIPVYVYWLLLSIKARSIMFFTAANPGIDNGGLFADSKKKILDKIPEAYIPKTLYFSKGTPLEEMKKRIQEEGYVFPLIAKPDIGERGFLVEKINSWDELQEYLGKGHVDILIQEFISFPEEVSILYYRFPDRKKGHITSVTLKKYLTVTGNGTDSIRELILAYPRARLQLDTLEDRLQERMDAVPERGEAVELVPIGNHCRGTTFLNGNHLIDSDLVDTFDRISHQLNGIYFGRFDIKCKSMDHLKKGTDFKILEINGVKSEPTHIYQPGFSIWKAYKVLFRHWNTIYKISMFNISRGALLPSNIDGIREMWAFQMYKKKGYKPV